MFIDSSALIAMLTDEADAAAFGARLQQSPKRMTSPGAVWEAAVGISEKLGLSIEEASGAIGTFVGATNIQVLATPPRAGFIALEVFDRFGEGRHPANLGFGECMAYACARYYRQPLLFKGRGFSQTDIEVA